MHRNEQMEPDGSRESVHCLVCGADDPAPYLPSPVQLVPKERESFDFVSCRVCGLVYLNPRPGPEVIGRYYPPDYLPHRGPSAWGRWAALVAAGQRALDRRRVRLVMRHVPITADTVLLDVGCGRPTFLESVQSQTGARCVGFDVSDAGWKGRSDSEPGRSVLSGMTLLRGALPEAESSIRDAIGGDGFHVATLWHALEHDPHPALTLEALRRLATPSARLIVEVPDLSSLTARLHRAQWAGLHTPRHTAAYTPDTLERLLARGGWQVERHVRNGTLDPYILWWLGRRNRRGDDLSGSLQGWFLPFLAGRTLCLPLLAIQRWLPLGVQTVVATRR